MAEVATSERTAHSGATTSNVIVVGAGISGLVAARELVRAGLSVTVLEARDRVGGRTLSTELDGQTVDLGGQWIGDQHHKLRALARELGVETFAQYHTGKKILDRGDKLKSFSGFLPRIGLFALGELGLSLMKLEKLAKRVPLEAPAGSEELVEFDRISLAEWLDRNVKRRDARDMIELAAQMIFAVEASELSFLYFLLYANSSMGLRRLAEIKNGAQERRFATGAQSVSTKLASALGDRIRLEHAVRAIEQDAAGVTVHTTRGTFRAGRAILALPPAMLGKLELSVSKQRALIHTQMPAGSVIKCIAAYRTPFWRERGYSGEAFSPRGLVRATFDDCSPDGKHAALVAFVVGNAARELAKLPEPERRQLVLRDLGRLHGNAAHTPTSYIDKNWLADEWSSGCYVGVLAPGMVAQVASALRAPEGRVHFAGTETAVHHIGYIEGAVEAGERSAQEVIAATREVSAIAPS